MNDHKILRALADGLTTSTEIAAHAKVTERTAQLALVRMLNHEKVTRALADSLKSAEKILDQLAKDHWPLVAHASPDPGASQSRWSSASATGSPR